jgi:hypothetical protein
MGAVTILRVGLAAISVWLMIIGLRGSAPAVKMSAPIGIMGLASTALYFLKDAVDQTLLITSVVVVFIIGSCWMLHLLSRQRAWLKSRSH